jgi:hypothetical protein
MGFYTAQGDYIEDNIVIEHYSKSKSKSKYLTKEQYEEKKKKEEEQYQAERALINKETDNFNKRKKEYEDNLQIDINNYIQKVEDDKIKYLQKNKCYGTLSKCYYSCNSGIKPHQFYNKPTNKDDLNKDKNCILKEKVALNSPSCKFSALKTKCGANNTTILDKNYYDNIKASDKSDSFANTCSNCKVEKSGDYNILNCDCDHKYSMVKYKQKINSRKFCDPYVDFINNNGFLECKNK